MTTTLYRFVPRPCASWAAMASAFTNVELLIDHLAKHGSLDEHRDAIAGYWRVLAGYGV